MNLHTFYSVFARLGLHHDRYTSLISQQSKHVVLYLFYMPFFFLFTNRWIAKCLLFSSLAYSFQYLYSLVNECVFPKIGHTSIEYLNMCQCHTEEKCSGKFYHGY